MRRLFLHLWLLVSFSAACADDLPKPEVIADLRILAVRAEPPEGAVGATVALDTLVVTVDPAAAIDRTWWACVAAGGSLDGPEACALTAPPTVTCADAPEATACLLGSDATASYRLPAQALVGRAAGEAGQVFIILLAADPATTSVADCAGALVGATVPEGCRIAAKRVAVSATAGTAGTAAAPNTNPTVSGLTISGAAVAVTVPPGAADPTPDGPEALFLSWFVTTGAIDSFRTDATGAGLMNSWTPPDAAGRIFVVVRDGRGGEAWVTGER
jgi:hypothetical protein